MAYRDISACLALVKNPSGFNEVLRLFASGPAPDVMVLALNDHGPDGADVSWIWDVDFEAYGADWPLLVISGRRAGDLALRLEYAGIVGSHAGQRDQWVLEEQIVKAFGIALERSPAGGSVAVLATYTAMWELRAELTRRRLVKPFWATRGSDS